MEWLGNVASAPMCPDEDPGSDPSSSSSVTYNVVHPHQQPPPGPLSDSDGAMSLCESQQRCVKASYMCDWTLAEAQDRLCSLRFHGSESLDQERARTLTCPAELTHTEQEWRRKESMLGGCDLSSSLVPGTVSSWDVFDKSIINVQNTSSETDQDRSKTFLQKYEQELRYFGMLHRWDDSQRFLSELPQLICEETANYLVLWCFRLQQEGKEGLMSQVAHQAVAMQFILEMASHTQQDPRSCFRQFFHKAKLGQEGYLDVFHAELEAFRSRVKEHTVKTKGDTPEDGERQSVAARCRLSPKEVLDSLPPELRASILLQDMQTLQNVLSTMNPQVAEYHIKRCLEAGLWPSTDLWTKDDPAEADDMRMMETS